MARAVMICSRDPFDLPGKEAFLEVADELTPEGITPGRPVMVSDRGARLMVVNPPPGLGIKGMSMCLGQMLKPLDDWWKPGANVPDGTFALFRYGTEQVEVVSDLFATRTVFYVMTEKLFIASTSQRAIVSFLGEFRLNRSAVAWFLSSGSTGPEDCWDERIRRLPPDSRAVLDRARWRLDVQSEPAVFAPEKRSPKEWRGLLWGAISEAVTSYDWGRGTWWLPLSGGYDSRCLLMLLEGTLRPHCVTWGLRKSKDMPENDAYIAAKVCRYYGLAHDYFETDMAAEPVETLVRRFLREGEGCTDILFPYLDGFSLWREMHARGCTGIIRGDQSFGRIVIPGDIRSRIYFGMTLLTDCFNPEDAARFELPAQRVPEGLRRAPGEPLSAYAERLYAVFHYPVNNAPLNNLKAGHVEIANPMLSRSVVGVIRRMPGSLTNCKWFYKKIVGDMSPEIPFAKLPAVDAQRAYLKNPDFVDYVRERLVSGTAAGLLPGDIREALSRQVQDDSRKFTVLRMRATLKQALPGWVLKQSLKFRTLTPDHSTIAMRAMLVSDMMNIFHEDAGLLERAGRSMPEPFRRNCLTR